MTLKCDFDRKTDLLEKPAVGLCCWWKEKVWRKSDFLYLAHQAFLGMVSICLPLQQASFPCLPQTRCPPACRLLHKILFQTWRLCLCHLLCVEDSIYSSVWVASSLAAGAPYSSWKLRLIDTFPYFSGLNVSEEYSLSELWFWRARTM